MAINFSKFNFFNRLSARGRIFFLLGVILGFLFVIYVGTRYLSTEDTMGGSRVANAPRGLQSVPGGQITPEYQRAIEQANVQRAQQAQISGGSAVPTLINIGGQTPPSNAAGCVICLDQSANVRYLLEDWVKQGKVTPNLSNAVIQLADKNPVLMTFSDQLNELIQEGKLAPDEGRELLDVYKKQHINTLLQESAKLMDGLIKSGQLPLDTANEFLLYQKNNLPLSDYSNELQEAVHEGLMSPSIATQLLNQYTQQRSREIILGSIAILHRMVKAGEIVPTVEKELEDLETRMVPVTDFSNALQQYVSSGKLAPMVSDKILDEYKQQKASMGAALGTLNQMVDSAEKAAYQNINQLLLDKKISSDVAQQLSALIQKDVTPEEFTAAVNALVQQNKLSPDIANQQISAYQGLKKLRLLSQRLQALQANNVSPPLFADELKKGVETGAILPDQAAQLLQEYQALTARVPVNTTPTSSDVKNEAFSKLKQQVQQNMPNTTPATANQFTAVQSQAETDAEQAARQQQQERLKALTAAMSNQAEKLLVSWAPPTMVNRVGDKAGDKSGNTASGSVGGKEGGDKLNSAKSSATSNSSGPIVKAGSILFAVLDTAANSDYPDSPVLATIVSGELKGAKLLGKLVTTKGVSGQMDRITLNFTLMNMDQWTKSQSVNAYAIDPDTARVSLASQVNYHYLKRFGAIMATSFLQGYATSITNAGTATTGIFGTSTTHPTLSPSNKIAVGLGQVGQTLGAITQNYVNIPPTVKVDSGVALGILFMTDVTLTL